MTFKPSPLKVWIYTAINIFTVLLVIAIYAKLNAEGFDGILDLLS